MQGTPPSNDTKELSASVVRSLLTGTPRYRILIVDDQADFLDAVAAFLGVEGHFVRTTARGNDLDSIIDLVNPDILITDIIMQEADILDVIPIVRQCRPELTIIAVSGNPHLLTLAAKQGAHHVLAKPFDLRKLSLLIAVARG